MQTRPAQSQLSHFWFGRHQPARDVRRCCRYGPPQGAHIARKPDRRSALPTQQRGKWLDPVPGTQGWGGRGGAGRRERREEKSGVVRAPPLSITAKVDERCRPRLRSGRRGRSEDPCRGRATPILVLLGGDYHAYSTYECTGISNSAWLDEIPHVPAWVALAVVGAAIHTAIGCTAIPWQPPPPISIAVATSLTGLSGQPWAESLFATKLYVDEVNRCGGSMVIRLNLSCSTIPATPRSDATTCRQSRTAHVSRCWGTFLALSLWPRLRTIGQPAFRL